MNQRPVPVDGTGRFLLAIASVAVAFAAADTYVVVLALPDMMAGVGLAVDELQRAAPIVSGFLLGYVAMLPLIGRIADLRGRLPVLVGSLVVFAFGSFVTAVATDLPGMVAGRFVQGVGGGGLVPATLSLVADLYPVHRRAVPLGLVSAVQEAGSVLGPLYGALVLAVAEWRAIFAVNVAVGLVIAVVLRALRGRARGADGAVRSGRRRDPLGGALLAVALACFVLVLSRPDALATSVRWGTLLLPVGVVGGTGGVWLSPLALTGLLAVLALAGLAWARPGGLVDLRGWVEVGRRADLLGAGLLALALAGVVLAFATADPALQVLSPAGPVYLAVSAVATLLLVLHLRRAAEPLVPRGALGVRASWGSLVVSFLVGTALIAALVDVPVFARVTVYPDSQLDAALVLVRFLVALPVGAVAGGYLCRLAPAGVVTAAGMAASVAGFVVMSGWGLTSLSSSWATVPLVLAGLGFGLALAPVNAVLLAATDDAVHGVASALVVVARMVGMLVGISALTTIGLRRYYAVQVDLPPLTRVCDGASRCDAYTTLLKEAGLVQLHAVFTGAALCAALAGLLALVLFARVDTRGVRTLDTVIAPAG